MRLIFLNALLISSLVA